MFSGMYLREEFGIKSCRRHTVEDNNESRVINRRAIGGSVSIHFFPMTFQMYVQPHPSSLTMN